MTRKSRKLRTSRHLALFVLAAMAGAALLAGTARVSPYLISYWERATGRLTTSPRALRVAILDAGALEAGSHGARLRRVVQTLAPRAEVQSLPVTVDGLRVDVDELRVAFEKVLAWDADIVLCAWGIFDLGGRVQPGFTVSPAVRALAQEMSARHTLIVAAAGTGVANPFRAEPVSQIFPQALPSTLVISALVRAGNAISPDYSENFGGAVDFAVLAPFGRSYLSNDAGATGSSFAAATVAGWLAANFAEQSALLRQEVAAGKLLPALRAATQVWPSYFAVLQPDPDVEVSGAADGATLANSEKIPGGGYGYVDPAKLDAYWKEVRRETQSASAPTCRWIGPDLDGENNRLEINVPSALTAVRVRRICEGPNGQTLSDALLAQREASASGMNKGHASLAFAVRAAPSGLRADCRTFVHVQIQDGNVYSLSRSVSRTPSEAPSDDAISSAPSCAAQLESSH